MYVSLKDIVSFATIGLFLLTFFTWVQVLSTVS